jgi:hypothetical protein
MNRVFSFSDGASLERRPEEKSPHLQTGNHLIKITITNKSSLFTLKVKFSFVNFNSCFGNELIDRYLRFYFYTSQKRSYFLSGDGGHDRGEDLPTSADQARTRRRDLGSGTIRQFPTVSLLVR